MDSGGRGMNPVAMTIINPRKECRGRQRDCSKTIARQKALSQTGKSMTEWLCGKAASSLERILCGYN